MNEYNHHSDHDRDALACLIEVVARAAYEELLRSQEATKLPPDQQAA